jgi:hypothetical protein
MALLHIKHAWSVIILGSLLEISNLNFHISRLDKKIKDLEKKLND